MTSYRKFFLAPLLALPVAVYLLCAGGILKEAGIQQDWIPASRSYTTAQIFSSAACIAIILLTARAERDAERPGPSRWLIGVNTFLAWLLPNALLMLPALFRGPGVLLPTFALWLVHLAIGLWYGEVDRTKDKGVIR
ncbi:MAG: hypothetical protein JST35_07485 [Armatimonadetes bacterium]|nr:hypothetical protein [Armatimonadota bacterium]